MEHIRFLGGLIDRTLHQLAKDVEEKGIIALDKKLQLKRQNCLHQPEQAELKKSFSEEPGGATLPTTFVKQTDDHFKMPAKFHNDAPSKHHGPRPRTETIAPLDMGKDETLPHDTATPHSTFYTPTVSAAEVKNQARRRKDKKVRQEASIAEGYGYDVIEKSEIGYVSNSLQH